MAEKYVMMPDGRVVKMALPDTAPAGGAQAQRELTKFNREGQKQEVRATLDTAIRGGLLGLPGLIGDAVTGVPNWIARKTGILDDVPENKLGEGGFMKWPSEALFDMTGGPLRTPDTPAGKVIGNVGAATVGGVAGGGPLSAGRRAVIGASSGAGSEAAANLFGDNLTSVLLGGLVGGAVPSLHASLRPNAEDLVRKALSGVTPEDFARARVHEAILEREGITSHLKSQLLGPSSSLDDVVAKASQDPTVRPQLLSATRDVIPQTEAAVRRWATEHLPINVEERRGMLTDIQNLANKARTELTNAANNAYTAAMPDLSLRYSPGHIKKLREELLALAKSDKYVLPKGSINPLIRFVNEKLPSRSVSAEANRFRRVDRQALIKELEQTLPEDLHYEFMDNVDSMTDRELVSLAARHSAGSMPIAALNNLLKTENLNALAMEEGWKGLPIKEIQAVLRKYTPEFDAARQARTKYINEFRTPFDQGLAGQIRRAGGGPDAERYTAMENTTRLVFPPNKSQPAAIERLAEDIGAEPVGWILRDHLEQELQSAGKAAFEETAKRRAPAKYVNAIAGSKAQRDNLDAGLFVVAKYHQRNPFAVRKGFYEVINALDTFRDLKLAPGISGAAIDFQAGKNLIGAGVAPGSRTGRWSWDFTSTKTYQQIADMVTSPDGLAKLEAIARSPTPQARQALISSILTTAAITPPLLPDSNTPENQNAT